MSGVPQVRLGPGSDVVLAGSAFLGLEPHSKWRYESELMAPMMLILLGSSELQRMLVPAASRAMQFMVGAPRLTTCTWQLSSVTPSLVARA